MIVCMHIFSYWFGPCLCQTFRHPDVGLRKQLLTCVKNYWLGSLSLSDILMSGPVANQRVLVFVATKRCVVRVSVCVSVCVWLRVHVCMRDIHAWFTCMYFVVHGHHQHTCTMISICVHVCVCRYMYMYLHVMCMCVCVCTHSHTSDIDR